jgi:hypothetical protein
MRMPDTGSLRDRMTTSTRCEVVSLKASSLRISEKAMPGAAGCPAARAAAHVAGRVAAFEDAVLFLEVEQGARGDRHHQLVVEGRPCRLISAPTG